MNNKVSYYLRYSPLLIGSLHGHPEDFIKRSIHSMNYILNSRKILKKKILIRKKKERTLKKMMKRMRDEKIETR